MPNLRARRSRGCELLCVMLAVGCEGGQSGDEGWNRQPSGGGDMACALVERELDETAVTAYGLGFEQLLARFEHIEAVPLYWKTYAWWEGEVRTVPGSTQTSLEVTAARREGAIIERVERPFEGNFASPCTGVHYDVPVTLSIATADGALDESIDSFLTIDSPQFALAQVWIDVDDLDGSLRLESDELAWNEARIGITLRLFRGGSLGRIELELEGMYHPGGEPSRSSDGEEPELDAIEPVGELSEPFETRSSRYIATWPSHLMCDGGMPPLRSDTQVIDESVEEILELVEMPVRALDDAPDAVVTIRPEPPQTDVCVGIGQNAILFSALGSVTAPELAIDARLTWRVIARTDLAGRLVRIDIERLEQESPVDAKLSSLLRAHVDGADAYPTLYLAAREQLTREGDHWAASGSLLVYGHDPAAGCAEDAAIGTLDAGAADASARDASTSCSPASPSVDEEGRWLPPGTPLLAAAWSTPDP